MIYSEKAVETAKYPKHAKVEDISGNRGATQKMNFPGVTNEPFQPFPFAWFGWFAVMPN